MFIKLASRNVKRQIGNYMIYFITVSLTVALMFAINNVIFSKKLQEYAAQMEMLRTGLIGITIFISLIVSFVLSYGTSFILKLRKREFGTYLTLGMTRKNILTIFVLETLILCIAALATGIVLGLFIYQGLMGLLTYLMEVEYVFADYSMEGMTFTIVMVTAVFLLSSVTSAIYLKRVSIYQLIHGDRMVEKRVKHPVFWMTLTLISLAGIVGSCIAFYKVIEHLFLSDGNASEWPIMGCMVVLAVTVVTFHTGFARSVVNLMLKNRKLCCRGTNIFVLRQLSGKLSANSIMAGALAFLIAFAAIGANVSFSQKITEQAVLNKFYPFDISAILDAYEENPIGLEEAREIILRYAGIEKEIDFNIYATGDNYLHGFTIWSGENFKRVKDSFIRESDINRLNAALGWEPIDLKGGFVIMSDIPQVMNMDFSSAELTLNGKTYSCTGKTDVMPLRAYFFFAAIVPDEAVEGLDIQTQCASFDLKDEKFDAHGLQSELSYSTNGNGFTFMRSDYKIKEYERLQRSSSTAIFIISTLYMAVVFVFMSMAILALKTLSGMSEDRRRYDVLFRLGAGEREQSKTLFLQIFSFFFLPFAIPLLLNIPAGITCSRIMELGGLMKQSGEILVTTVLITTVMAAIYLLYFGATYLIAKHNIVRTNI
ncbi:ABC transporter permease [Clostridium thermosuccinogenes]|uniref:ABC transporter permease n=1 Tax=Clostridium thermosuccinogenes TaxID=84032 RepID=UPI000CCC2455|nr:ABC transporter permease [Pseudoclostridium thermosuccinogenes]PNT93419.1 hypothetical protein CDQ83_07885 [Pseudoclostridium thermosuccinogenes]